MDAAPHASAKNAPQRNIAATACGASGAAIHDSPVIAKTAFPEPA